MSAIPASSDARVRTGVLPAADVLLANGTVAVIRAVRPEDRPGLETLHDEASDASLRLRFFATSHRAGHDYVAHLFEGGGADTIASLVATVPSASRTSAAGMPPGTRVPGGAGRATMR